MFQCDKCGMCCRNIALNTLYKRLDRGDGVCKYFDEENNLCSIYENRPIICNIDLAYEVYYSQIMSKEEFYQINKDACEMLKKD